MGQFGVNTDARDRVITESLSDTYTTAYTYHGNGNRLTIQRPGGGQWHYTYTPAKYRDHLRGCGHLSGGTFSYDGNNNLVSMQEQSGGGTSVSSAYGYGTLRDTHKLDRYSHGGDSRYEYDCVNRLASLTHQAFGGEVARYAYDPNGNQTGKTQGTSSNLCDLPCPSFLEYLLYPGMLP